MDILHFLILALAAWRCASLLANEYGPFGVFEWLRARAGVRTDDDGVRLAGNTFAQGLMCLWCCSVWVGTGWTVAFLLLGDVAVWLATPLALSGFAIFFDFFDRQK